MKCIQIGKMSMDMAWLKEGVYCGWVVWLFHPVPGPPFTSLPFFATVVTKGPAVFDPE